MRSASEPPRNDDVPEAGGSGDIIIGELAGDGTTTVVVAVAAASGSARLCTDDVSLAMLSADWKTLLLF